MIGIELLIILENLDDREGNTKVYYMVIIFCEKNFSF